MKSNQRLFTTVQEQMGIIIADILRDTYPDIQHMNRDQIQKRVRSLLSNKHFFHAVLLKTNQIIASVTETDDLSSSYRKVISLLNKGIRANRVRSNIQYHLLGKIDNIKIVSPNKLLDYVKRTGQSRDPIYQIYMKNCGTDGLNQRAFYLTNNHMVILCPGLLLFRGIGLTQLKKISLIIHILSHEIAHSISSNQTIQKNLYDRYSYCMSKYYIKGKKPSYLSNRLNEITADFWSIQAVASYIEELDFKTDISRYYTVQDIFGQLCGTPDSGIHPSGRFRIEKLLRRDPRIHRVMKCGAIQNDRSFGCDLTGAVRLD